MIEGLKSLKKIKPNITGLIAKQCKENWQDVFVCWPFLNNRANRQYVFSQSLSNIGKLIRLKLVQTWNDRLYQHFLLKDFAVLRQPPYSCRTNL
jgi:hypothetical protein